VADVGEIAATVIGRVKACVTSGRWSVRIEVSVRTALGKDKSYWNVGSPSEYLSVGSFGFSDGHRQRPVRVLAVVRRVGLQLEVRTAGEIPTIRVARLESRRDVGSARLVESGDGENRENQDGCYGKEEAGAAQHSLSDSCAAIGIHDEVPPL
jgi:hypothetical protein